MQILNLLTAPFLYKIKPVFIPLRGLNHLNQTKWKAVDNDPQFITKPLRFKILKGWISIRVKIKSEKVIIPKLYFDTGDGYSESSVVYMYQYDENFYHAELMLVSPPISLRFDPMEEAGEFEFSNFQIRRHSTVFYILHQLYSIIRNDVRHGKDPLRILKKSYARYKKHNFGGMLERLGREYKKLHPYRIQRETSQHINYLNWIKKNEKDKMEYFSDKVLLHAPPLISIVMATYNTPKEYLKQAIESVLMQTYPYWELCIADDASDDENTIHTLKYFAKQNKKIKIKFRKVNGKISLASNDALDMMNGKYVAFMDHDDMLAPNALFEVVKAIDKNPEIKLIYTDEDKIDEKNRRYDPHFKSDWNPDMFFSQNYISHLSVVETDLLKKIGFLRTGYEGAQDYDLLLRVIEKISSCEIRHIDKILYHWRAIEGSTAFDPSEKPYTSKAGLLALKDYFSRKYSEVKIVEGTAYNTYKVIYPIMDEPLVSLIIPTRDSYDILSRCIQSILDKTTYKNYEIIIVDNQTKDSRTLTYFDELRKAYQHIRIIRYDHPFNYAAINNFGVSHAFGEVVGLINNDIEVISKHWLTEMIQHALRPEIGAVGAKLYYDNNTIQHAGVIVGLGGVAGHSHKHFHREEYGYFSRLQIIQNLSAVTSACLLIRKKLYQEVGGMNETHLEVAFNDVDFCLEIGKKGYRNLWTPYAELYHLESVSRGAEDTEEKKMRFLKEIKYMQKKWGDRLLYDPFYNVNLTLDHENFMIKK